MHLVRRLTSTRWTGSLFAVPRRVDELDLPDLGPDAAGGPMQIVAHPSNGALVPNGIVFTSLGGMATVPGIALTSIGCATDSRGMCNAGLITSGSGAGHRGAIWMLLAG